MPGEEGSSWKDSFFKNLFGLVTGYFRSANDEFKEQIPLDSFITFVNKLFHQLEGKNRYLCNISVVSTSTLTKITKDCIRLIKIENES
ncbi:unnamed protein product [Ambrosiozyma monospora]|uniref:Unnamed protein product n=1 Tax=Ambrosiozyma monospora TaxID=43982 RepID=A0A9W6SUK7_AMBMO|nr:unnamed protein product [Ambrosiozyma monospora]